MVRVTGKGAPRGRTPATALVRSPVRPGAWPSTFQVVVYGPVPGPGAWSLNATNCPWLEAARASVAKPTASLPWSEFCIKTEVRGYVNKAYGTRNMIHRCDRLGEDG